MSLRERLTDARHIRAARKENVPPAVQPAVVDLATGSPVQTDVQEGNSPAESNKGSQKAIEDMNVRELRAAAKAQGLTGYGHDSKAALVKKLVKSSSGK